MEVISYGGWPRCARLVSGDLELVVTLDVGPRVIRLGFVGGLNELYEHPDQMGVTGGDVYRTYGGHRLWIAPEIAARTLTADNEPVLDSEQDGWNCFLGQPDVNGIQKELRIKPSSAGFSIEHRVHSKSAFPLEFAPWALTQMAPGGVAYWPMPEFRPHSEHVLPARSMALWHYTNLGDPRLAWSQSLACLRHDASMGPIKLGMFVDQGWAAYANHGNVFLKGFSGSPGDYPDLGSNFETFTNQPMLELESLGPTVRLGGGAFVSHREAWSLSQASVPAELPEAFKRLSELAERGVISALKSV